MIRINLMPRAEARRQAARQRDKQLGILIAVVLVSTIGVAEFVTRRESNRVAAEAETYKEELAQLSAKHNAAIRLEKKRDELHAKLSTIKILERQRTGPVHVLDHLSGATPEKLWLTEMREAGGSMTLFGKGLDNQTIALFMRNLGASPYFENVDLVETKQIEEGQAKLKEFSIRASVNYAGRSVPDPVARAGGAGSETGSPAPGQAGKNSAVAGPIAGALAGRNAAQSAAQATEARQDAQDATAQDLAREPREPQS